jgi:hypothetical protein
VSSMSLSATVFFSISISFWRSKPPTLLDIAQDATSTHNK